MFFFFSILFTLRESGCSAEKDFQQNSRIHPISGSCVHKSMPKLAVDGCCFAAAYGIRPWAPWICGILNFRSIRVIDLFSEAGDYNFSMEAAEAE